MAAMPYGKAPEDGGATILCVEDEDDLRADLAEELAEAGYRVLEARDAIEAFDRLATARPDLILCDINLPDRNGYEILRVLRDQHPEMADVPFVFLTALGDPREVVEGKLSGADDYLVKPVDFDIMLATIDARLRQVARIKARAARDLDQLRAALAGLQRDARRDALPAVSQALDYVALGIILLDRQANVVFANRAARTLSSEADGLFMGTALGSARAAETQDLKEAIRRAPSSAEDGEAHVACLRFTRPSGRRDLLLLVCPLSRPMGDGDPNDPVAIVLVSDPERRPHVPADVLASLFGLTPTEADIALRLAEGNRLSDIAAQLNVSQTTIAYHMRNLFQKTETNRQADLVALVLAGPMAMALG